jgi:hypothetical protein
LYALHRTLVPDVGHWNAPSLYPAGGDVLPIATVYLLGQFENKQLVVRVSRSVKVCWSVESTSSHE